VKQQGRGLHLKQAKWRELLRKFDAGSETVGQVAELKRQLKWFMRQLFGRKSERFAPLPSPQQISQLVHGHRETFELTYRLSLC
jgi:hypothetical protein